MNNFGNDLRLDRLSFHGQVGEEGKVFARLEGKEFCFFLAIKSIKSDFKNNLLSKVWLSVLE